MPQHKYSLDQLLSEITEENLHGETLTERAQTAAVFVGVAETVAEWIARGNTPRRIEPLRLTFDDFLRIIDTIPQKEDPCVREASGRLRRPRRGETDKRPVDNRKYSRK